MSVATLSRFTHAPDHLWRGNQTGRIVEAIVWIAARRSPFVVDDLAHVMGLCRRNTYRWLYALEASDIVRREEPHYHHEKRRYPQDRRPSSLPTLWHNTGRLRS